MFGTPNIDAEQQLAKHTPTANNAAVVTLTPTVVEELFVVDHIAWSYDLTPTGGRLTVAIAGVTVFDADITTAGPGFFNFHRGLAGGPNETIVVTLAAGGAGVSGKLNVDYH